MRPFFTSLLLAGMFCAAAVPAHSQGAKITPAESRTVRGQSTAGQSAEAASSQTPESSEPAATNDRQQQRAAWFLKGRTAMGEQAAYLLNRAYRQKLALRARRAAATAAWRPGQATSNFANLNWTSLGPSPMSSDPTGSQDYGFVTGRVTAIAVDQKDMTGNTVFVGGAFGGVWKSTNAANAVASAVTWQPVFDSQPTLAVGAIAIQPGGNVVLVGTGEANNSVDSYYGMGIFRSADNGQTWTQISAANGNTRPFRGLGFSEIAFSTSNQNLVVAAAGSTIGADNGAELQGADGRGLYVSTDAGLTWSYASITDPGAAVQPGSTSGVAYNPAHGLFYAAVRFHGFYQSSDGFNWTRLPNQPGSVLTTTNCPSNPVSFNCPLYRASITVRPITGETYAAYVDSSGNTSANGPGIWRLSGANGTWTSIGINAITTCGDSFGCGTEQGTYNLYLRAVPTGANTDLYFGAINIYKCTVTAVDPTCASNTWKNLTHVYGCTPFGAPAHVHPDQHALDFSLSAPNIMYFGNDGGVNRTLTASQFTSGACTATQPFQNLNAGLGSFSQFVNFSQHPTDPGILLGGLQDNGSPLTDAATGTVWRAINLGDGGYNAIDSNNPSLLFTSFAASNGTQVQLCTQGLACDNSKLQNVLGPGQMQGDAAAFYMPYMLDPANSGRMIAGTCRVWRGNAAGSGFALVSHNFVDQITGVADSVCASGSTGQTHVRSMAAGGPSTANGSQVIYAGLESSTEPGGGHIFVTTAADNGLDSWVDRTGSINPSGYDISDIAIAPGDATGRTAYVTIMGFSVAHVFKTTDAGVTWIDKTADLPDAPADSIAVDPANARMLYVGNDVGVFVSSDDGASWAELGTGLPNVPVTALKVFDSGAGDLRLRAATYGRGLWEIPLPKLTLSFSPPSLSFLSVVGHDPPDQAVTVRNETTSPINISGVTLNSGGAFQSGTTCGGALAAGATCQLSAGFHPPGQGTFSGSLVVTDDADPNPAVIPLLGNSIDFALNFARPARPARSTNSTVMASASQRVTVDLALTSSAADAGAVAGLPELQVQLTCAGAPRGWRCSVTPTQADLSFPQTAVTVVLEPARRKQAQRLLSPQRATLRVTAKAGALYRTFDIPVRLRE